MNLMNFPLLVLAFTFVPLFLAAYVGDLLRNKVLPLKKMGGKTSALCWARRSPCWRF